MSVQLHQTVNRNKVKIHNRQFESLHLSSRQSKVATKEHDKIKVIFLCTGNSQWSSNNTQSESDWQFNTQSTVQQADGLMLVKQ